MTFETILNLLKPLIEAYSGDLGFMVQLVSIVGSIRLLIKPIMTALEIIVVATPSKKDDLLPQKIKDSKIYKGFIFFLDYIFSLKIKKK